MAECEQDRGTPTPEKNVTHHATPVSVKKLMFFNDFNVYSFSARVNDINHDLSFISR